MLNDKIALWDVYDMAIRSGSSDKNIIAGKYNDIYNFLKEHKSINKIIFCGISETSKVHPIRCLKNLLENKFEKDELNRLNNFKLEEKFERLEKQITKQDITSKKFESIVFPKPSCEFGIIKCIFLPSTSKEGIRKKEDFVPVCNIWQNELKESINE